MFTVTVVELQRTLVDEENTNPMEFQNVAVYVGDNFYDPANVKVRNLDYTTPLSSCPSGWKYYYPTNRCYRYFIQESGVTWWDAQIQCRSYKVSIFWFWVKINI